MAEIKNGTTTDLAAVEARLEELEVEAAYAEMNAERLDDGDDAAGAESLRRRADALHDEAEALAAAHGIELYADPV